MDNQTTALTPSLQLRAHYSHSAMKNTGQTINLSAVVPDHLAGQRLDQALAEMFSNFSRARLQTWIRDHQVMVNGQSKRPRDRVLGGEEIVIAAVLPDQMTWEAQPITLDIIYEDDAIIVVNKPVGLVVHPAVGNRDSTLVNALLHHSPELNKLPRAGIVHRLDKNTSGLIVIAKTLPAHTSLVRQLQARTISREYSAIVQGVLVAGGTIDMPIGRHPLQRKHMAVVESGKPATTHYRVIERFRAHTWVRVNLETGRTHQIRVHMAHLRHPIVGDATYGGRLKMPSQISEVLRQALRAFKHQALHAQRLGLLHPTTLEPIEWQAPLPDDMQHLLNLLREDLSAKNLQRTNKW